MASVKMKLSVLKENGSPDSAPKLISKEASPDSKCPICLDRFKNVSYADKCLHRFCFRCILEWSKNKAECPLCKQPFGSIYHSVKAEDDFKQYELRPSENGSFGLAGQRFRYRTTLTGERRNERRTSTPPDHGVMFEGLSGPVSHGNERGFRRMFSRLAYQQRAQSEGRTLRTLRESEMIQFRRTLYRRGLRVRDVRDGGRSRETSSQFFRSNPACLHRLVPWLKRELTVLYGSHGSLVNIVQHIVMSQITRYDMQDAAVLQELRPFLLSRTEHFLHEFLSFARSPFNMEAYDQHAVYDCPAPSADQGSDTESSVITVSEDEANPPGPDSRGISAALSQTPWDDETPGPSYSTDSPRVFTISITSSDEDSDEEPQPGPSGPAKANAAEASDSSAEEDCVIVGFVKPTTERTPELVLLSSNSEEEEEQTINKQTSKPQHIRFTSPTNSPSSAHSVPSLSPPSSDRNRTSSRSLWASPRRSNRDDSDKRRHKKSKQNHKSRHRSRSRSQHRSRHRYKSRSRSNSRYRSNSKSMHRSRSGSRLRSRMVSSNSHRRRSWSKEASSLLRPHRHYSDVPIRPKTPSLHCREHRNSAHSQGHDKPGGKRKYKSLHLEPSTIGEPEKPTEERKKRSGKKERRSPSVEIIHGEEERSRKKQHKKKKKHKKKRKRSKEREKERRGEKSKERRRDRIEERSRERNEEREKEGSEERRREKSKERRRERNEEREKEGSEERRRREKSKERRRERNEEREKEGSEERRRREKSKERRRERNEEREKEGSEGEKERRRDRNVHSVVPVHSESDSDNRAVSLKGAKDANAPDAAPGELLLNTTKVNEANSIRVIPRDNDTAVSPHGPQC
ncbi:topoisomerase I binding, arginine/serine-rich a [Hoplias malabaricus]|uniref:topoisomerase I binding, arginine/serine-rich a n=1 Tax=Hoplias malabaricus TaxID=27720 RepID=UPI003462CD6D